MIRIMSADEFTSTRKHSMNEEVSRIVRDILMDVKARGDDAVRDYELKFDGVKLGNLELSEEHRNEAVSKVSRDYISMLERCAANITDFHSRQKSDGFSFSPKEGVILGQKITPVQKAGIYVPGGTASYPSTVLMNAIPAKTAGCPQIMIATPPPVRPEIIAAAEIAGVHRIFTMGGAQAIGAFAFGTQSVPKADVITGPGNVYVAEAKRQVFGLTGIDMVAGPSEILIIADEDNNPAFLAADMLAQAEHDKSASAILITTSTELAHKVCAEIEAQITGLPRYEIARASIDSNGAVVIVPSTKEAVTLANEIAPEHLELCVRDPFAIVSSVINAGSIFIGANSPEALGDYYAGTNHTLPTMGTAKFSSPLSTDTFTKKTQLIYYTDEALMKAADDIELFAMSEGLQAHARSISARRV